MEMNSFHRPLCHNQATAGAMLGSGVAGYRFDCSRCGRFDITDLALHSGQSDFVRGNLYLISGFLRLRAIQQPGSPPLLIDRDLLCDDATFTSRILSIAPRDVNERLDGLLETLSAMSKHPGAPVQLDLDVDYPLGFSRGRDEFRFYLTHLYEASLLSGHDPVKHGSPVMMLTVKAWEYLRARRTFNREANQAFVAMWFDSSTTQAWLDGIRPLEMDTGFRMARIDKEEFNDKICDKILAEIRRSRFLIAELTGKRHGVYFEAGFALGLGMPVIWMCNQSELENIHFDTRQYNYVVWASPEELREKARDRILATVGRGAYAPALP